MIRRLIPSAVLTIGLAGLLAGCSSNNENSAAKGSLAISLGATGAPNAESLQAADHDGGDALSGLASGAITIAGIEARMADRTWVPVETGLPVDVDLIAIMNAGAVATLPADLLPEGDYDALALRITQVQVAPKSEPAISLVRPESGWTVRVPVSFSIVAGRSTGVNLKLRCGSSFSRIDGQFEFDPEIDVEGVEHDR